MARLQFEIEVDPSRLLPRHIRIPSNLNEVLQPIQPLANVFTRNAADWEFIPGNADRVQNDDLNRRFEQGWEELNAARVAQGLEPLQRPEETRRQLAELERGGGARPNPKELYASTKAAIEARNQREAIAREVARSMYEQREAETEEAMLRVLQDGDWANARDDARMAAVTPDVATEAAPVLASIASEEVPRSMAEPKMSRTKELVREARARRAEKLKGASWMMKRKLASQGRMVDPGDYDTWKAIQDERELALEQRRQLVGAARRANERADIQNQGLASVDDAAVRGLGADALPYMPRVLDAITDNAAINAAGGAMAAAIHERLRGTPGVGTQLVNSQISALQGAERRADNADTRAGDVTRAEIWAMKARIEMAYEGQEQQRLMLENEIRLANAGDERTQRRFEATMQFLPQEQKAWLENHALGLREREAGIARADRGLDLQERGMQNQYDLANRQLDQEAEQFKAKLGFMQGESAQNFYLRTRGLNLTEMQAERQFQLESRQLDQQERDQLNQFALQSRGQQMQADDMQFNRGLRADAYNRYNQTGDGALAAMAGGEPGYGAFAPNVMRDQRNTQTDLGYLGAGMVPPTRNPDGTVQGPQAGAAVAPVLQYIMGSQNQQAFVEAVNTGGPAGLQQAVSIARANNVPEPVIDQMLQQVTGNNTASMRFPTGESAIGQRWRASGGLMLGPPGGVLYQLGLGDGI